MKIYLEEEREKKKKEFDKEIKGRFVVITVIYEYYIRLYRVVTCRIGHFNERNVRSEVSLDM